MAINLDKLVGFHQNALKVRNNQMEVMSGNLANANTPGYKARAIDFNQAMAAARHASGQSMTRTHENHMSGTMISTTEIGFRIPTQPDTGDGNTVEVQQERNAFLDTSMRYQATVEFLNGKIKGMKKAISGGQGQ